MMSMPPPIGGSADAGTRIGDVRRSGGHPTTRPATELPQLWLRGLLTLLLVVHGLAHLQGTDTALRAVKQQVSSTFVVRGSTSVDYLAGHWEVSYQPTLLLIALCWIVVTIGFLVAAGRLWHMHRGWWALVMSFCAASLVLSLIALPQTAIGVAIDASLLIALLWARYSAQRNGRKPLYAWRPFATG